jgi:DMSO/TMAO reductase YedYZ molybdopterin-dependent catalytic subunit
MRLNSRFRAAIVAVVAALAVVVLPASGVVSAQPQAAPTVSLIGAVQHPKTLGVADLAKMPSRWLPVVFDTSNGTEAHLFRGPTLYDVVQAAGPKFNPAQKNDQLRFVVLGTGTDGYRAVVSWAEVDPAFARIPVLLAYSQDGKRLERPRLVVPGDIKGGRYVSDLAQLKLAGVS